MRKEEKIVYKYITDDGKEFESESEARKHELSLIYKNVIKTKCNIRYFTLYTVNNYKEIEALFYIFGDYDRIPEVIKSYPCIICRYYYPDSGYEYCFIDDIINDYSDIVNKLKEYKNTSLND